MHEPSDQHTRLVRPLGKFGRAYLLDERTHQFYRACLIGFLVAVLAFGQAEVAGPRFYSPWPISDEAFYCVLVLIGLLGAICLQIIASRGTIAGDNDGDGIGLAKDNSSKPSIGDKFIFIVLSIASAAFALVLSIAIYLEITTKTATASQLGGTAVIVLLSVYVSVKFFRKSRTGSTLPKKILGSK
jgi:hypothetical protein